MKCAMCGSDNTHEWIESQDFPYGCEPETIMLTVDVPVIYCENEECGFMFTDYRSEDIRTAAVLEHEQKQGIIR